MSTDKPITAAQKAIGNFAPKLVELTDGVLFDDIWERPQLSKRDRSLITCMALVATGKTEQMDFHFPKAIENGVTKGEGTRGDRRAGYGTARWARPRTGGHQSMTFKTLSWLTS